ncbi:MAG: hypothetical protein E8D45_11185 [Nitrospira sp.]|nr:MAG: hypothetical protein E8D45_11185 [Nitrospira sp.]
MAPTVGMYSRNGVRATPAEIHQESTDRYSTSLVLGSAAVIFLIDLILPRGIAIGVLYIIPILISLHPTQPKFTLAVGGICTGLTVIGYVLSPSGATSWLSIGNRGLSIAAIWVTVFLSQQQAEATRRIQALQALLPICASCKKIRDDQGAWSQVEQYLEAHTKTVFTHSLCPHCVRKWYPELHPELSERYPEIFDQV